MVELKDFAYRSGWAWWNQKSDELMTKKGIILTVVGIIVGVVAGYFYYVEVGCTSGTCPITSKPLNSTLYGGLLGGLLFNMFVKSPKG